MPNWITNKIAASKSVIQAVVNDKGEIDFNLIAPFPGPNGLDWNGIYCDAETAAKAVLGTPIHSHPLLASLEMTNRQQVDIKKLNDKSFQ
jgi:hypothetical protein